jgi:hypothetical protein
MTLKTIDISGDVSAEDYRRVYESLLEQFEAWRQEHDWCTEFYRYHVARLSRTFRWNEGVTGYYRYYDGKMELDITGRTPAQMGQDLRELRGRILLMTIRHSDYLSLPKANEFLVNSGLPPYAPPQEQSPKARCYVSASGFLSTELPQEELQRKLEKYLKRLGMANPDVYVEARRPDAPQSRVPESETVPLLPSRRS